ncbi:NUDIX hydrolase [Hahella sp. CCB-MM4]|uniref:NUDIX hydrolase n=1 Tax=Hahella sp. (strain CCB-MM4) TaxID=1926491 RepID=UPI000B9B5E17|nr:NUDIX hydrolase [Hahella sp. CCB-MM4]OZG70119.1 NUDIX hydrolase [Hahella sp. CCB-MM4]
MKFCSQCGNPVEQRVPDGDNRHRHVCPTCDTIHYINPKIVAGTIPVYEDKILLCRRAIEPRLGYWTLPAGFMEMNETTSQAAIRETWEEAEARVNLEGLYTMIDVPHIGQVHIFYRATVINGEFGIGPESLETKLFREEDIPWEEIAFPTVKYTLEHYLEDRQSRSFPVHVKDITYERIKS